jgi:hypothetical protein
MNSNIRKSTAHQAELAEMVAICEICGKQGLFDDFLWCSPCDIIHCDNVNCVDAHINCKQPVHCMGETDGFVMHGFKHVTYAGICAFWCLLEEKGSIDLLWDMKPTTKTDTLMCTENFNLDTHIKMNYCDHDSIVYSYDDILTEIHDEMIGAITILEFCFNTQTFDMQINGREFIGLDKIKLSDTWSPNVYYPLPTEYRFKDFDSMSEYCCNSLCEEGGLTEVNIRVETGVPHDPDGSAHIAQIFTWKITGAMDCNILGYVVDTLEDNGYDKVIFFNI